MDIAAIGRCRELLGAAGIRVGFFIQLGYLGEELQDLLATRELIQSLRPDSIGVSVSYPLPGTRFFEQVRAQLGSKTHWEDSDDLEMMFCGTYSSDFYRQVRDLLHQQIRADTSDALVAQRWEALLAVEPRYRSSPALLHAG